jgi:PHD/YefM family antitoxin component YafN of YafNO toxin-antitoxin module
MKFVTVSELRLRATQIVSEIEKTRKEVVVTKMGKPVVLLRAVEEEEFELKSMKGGKSNGKG